MRSRTSKTRRFDAVLSVLVLGLVGWAAFGCEPLDEKVNTGPPEVNYWEQRKESCEAILSSPHAYEVAQVTRCMKIWETYRPVGDLSVDMRSMYAIGFSLAWYNAANDYDRMVAEAALARLCIPLHPMGNDGKIQEQVPTALQCSMQDVAQTSEGGEGGEVVEAAGQASEGQSLADRRGSVAVEARSGKRAKKAKGLNKKGYRAHSKKQYGNAADFYEQALALYPHYVTAKYNLVCALAKMGDDESALDTLEELYTWDDSEVNARLIKARNDEDLITLRDYKRFKMLTGYFRLTLANGAGEMGVEQLTRIQGELTARRYTVHQVVTNKRPKLHPEIWFRPGFEGYAEEFKTIIGARKVSRHEIDWDTLEDIIIVWGQPEAASLYSSDSQMAPIVQGVSAREESGGLDALSGAVKDTQGSVEGAMDTGKGVGEAVPAE